MFTSAPTWMLQCERELWISGAGFAGILCKLPIPSEEAILHHDLYLHAETAGNGKQNQRTS